MSIINKLATSLNRRDEVPNQNLAKQIVKNSNKKAIAELFENLHNKNKGVQSDCIKVIYETALLKPELVAGYVTQLLALLNSKINRQQWGAMIALHYITDENPKAIYAALPNILDAADKGSVITNDHCVGILIKLCAAKKYAADAFALLNERLKKCLPNQLPMYVENAMQVINETNKATFIKTLQTRLSEIEKDTKRIRVEKVINKLKG
jgi:hypothetical protein